jgi:hypothetical protein
MHLSLKYKSPGGFLSFAFLSSLELTKEIEVNASVVSLVQMLIYQMHDVIQANKTK